MFKHKIARARRLSITASVIALLLFSCPQFPAQKKKVGRQPVSGSEMLARANLYYSSDDITDRAAVEYKNVIRVSSGSKEAEAAQYLLASYYHRKFYIVRERKGENDEKAINEAEDEYNDYIQRYERQSSPEWLADAYFNLALIWLEYGNRAKSLEKLNSLRTASAKDPRVYIYDVIWSPYSRDRVEGYYSAAELADVLQRLVQSNLSTSQIVERLRDWCRSRVNKKF